MTIYIDSGAGAAISAGVRLYRDRTLSLPVEKTEIIPAGVTEFTPVEIPVLRIAKIFEISGSTLILFTAYTISGSKIILNQVQSNDLICIPISCAQLLQEVSKECVPVPIYAKGHPICQYGACTITSKNVITDAPGDLLFCLTATGEFTASLTLPAIPEVFYIKGTGTQAGEWLHTQIVVSALTFV